ncbi:MAG TPA: hypothetical protein VK195_05380 [Burkholderiaceae bacterium]|nr:hypothetical protein [Burkholderiaceae bacterium]
MFSAGVFEGVMVIDGQSHGLGVDVGMDPTLFVRPHPRGMASPGIGLVPFSRYMLLVQDATLMAQGFHYEVQGECLGWVVVGSAADGFDNHPVTAFNAQVRYAGTGIRVEITGRTIHEGRVGRPTRDYPPDPRSFIVRFEIPKGRLAECFQLSEAVKARVEALFEQVFGTP